MTARSLAPLVVLVLVLSAASAASVYAQADQQGTLPPVVVTPQDEYVPMETFPGGIPWSSDEIYSDTQRVGPYNQPVWTTQRPFATSRAYVLPPGQVQVEQWVRPTFHRDSKNKYRFLEEVAIGLPGRFQLDLYERWNIEPDAMDQQDANHEGVQIELRWALADWDEIFLNPTLYIEWVEKGGPQEKPNVYEAKLLLSEELAPNLYYASNFVLEQETSGEREQELAWSNAFGTTLVERKLMAGLEMNWTSTTVHGGRGEHEVNFLIGPSLQYRPTNRTFLDVVGLFGTNSASPYAQMFIIFGYQFGTRAGPSTFAPAATIGN